MRLSIVPLLALGILMARSASADAVSVSATLTPVGSQWRYDYTLTNLSAADSLVLLSLTRPGPASVTDIMSPTGWMSSNLDDNFLDFIAEGAGLSPADGPLPGFSFVSPGKMPVNYQAFDASGNEYTGSVSELSPVPEPGSLALLAIATPGLILRRRLHRGSVAGLVGRSERVEESEH